MKIQYVKEVPVEYDEISDSFIFKNKDFPKNLFFLKEYTDVVENSHGKVDVNKMKDIQQKYRMMKSSLNSKLFIINALITKANASEEKKGMVSEEKEIKSTEKPKVSSVRRGNKFPFLRTKEKNDFPNNKKSEGSCEFTRDEKELIKNNKTMGKLDLYSKYFSDKNFSAFDKLFDSKEEILDNSGNEDILVYLKDVVVGEGSSLNFYKIKRFTKYNGDWNNWKFDEYNSLVQEIINKSDELTSALGIKGKFVTQMGNKYPEVVFKK